MAGILYTSMLSMSPMYIMMSTRQKVQFYKDVQKQGEQMMNASRLQQASADATAAANPARLATNRSDAIWADRWHDIYSIGAHSGPFVIGLMTLLIVSSFPAHSVTTSTMFFMTFFAAFFLGIMSIFFVKGWQAGRVYTAWGGVDSALFAIVAGIIVSIGFYGEA